MRQAQIERDPGRNRFVGGLPGIDDPNIARLQTCRHPGFLESLEEPFVHALIAFHFPIQDSVLHRFLSNDVGLFLLVGKRLLHQRLPPHRGKVIVADFLRGALALPGEGGLNFSDLALDFPHLGVVVRECGAELRVLALQIGQLNAEVLQQFIFEDSRQRGIIADWISR